MIDGISIVLFCGLTVKGPTHGVSYLNHSNPLLHVQLTSSLTLFTLGVNFPSTLGCMWFKSYLIHDFNLKVNCFLFNPLVFNGLRLEVKE